MRGLISLCASLCVGALVGWASGQWWGAVLDASLVGVACWLCVDGSRALVSRWRWRRMGLPLDQTGPAPDGTFRQWPGWPWVATCVLLGGSAGVLLGGVLAQWVGAHVGVSSHLSLLLSRPGHERTGLTGLMGLLLGTLILAFVISYFFYIREQAALNQQEAEAAHRLAAESQLRLLQAQLEPHMLFNTLANLRVLITLDPKQAQHMLDRLIGFLRATLSASRRSSHTLAEEFDRLGEYLALMQIRMGPRLRTELDLPEPLRGCMVPPLLLQPLVENAIHHGLEPRIEGGILRVSARAWGEGVCIEVQDNGLGLDEGHDRRTDTLQAAGGFGLQQVRDRLQVTWGAAASCVLTRAPGGGTLATLLLPPQTARIQPSEQPTHHAP